MFSCGFDVAHSIGVSKVVDVEQVVSFLQQIERIESIGLHSCTLINNLSSITIEDCPFSISLSKRLLEAFTDSVGEIAINFRSNL